MVFHLVAVLHGLFLRLLHSQCRRGGGLHEMVVFIVFRMVGVLDGQCHIGIRIIGESVMVSVLEGGENGVGVNTDSFRALPAVPFMVGAADGNPVGVVCKNDDEGIVPMFLRPFFRIFDGLVEFDGIVSRPLPVHDVELLINGGAFDHGEEAVGVL